MRKWLNTELTKSEWEKTRVFLKENAIRYEASGCGSMVHIEIYANAEETDMINSFLDVLAA